MSRRHTGEGRQTGEGETVPPADDSSSDSEEEKSSGGGDNGAKQRGEERKSSLPVMPNPARLLNDMIAAAVKNRKISLHFPIRHDVQPTFGVCFDIDGVLARGSIPIVAAQEGLRKLMTEDGAHLKYPVAFVTNALNTNQDKADQLSSFFGVTISKDQMVQSPSPLEVFEQFHSKFCLLVGQGKIREISKELGFTKFCTVEDISAARPLLDVIDHEKRKLLDPNFVNKDFPAVEAILLMGEPKQWESALQIIVDLLVTHGHLDAEPDSQPKKHIPVIACNFDLRFMERAHMPRFAHGAFLACLEALYKKVTGSALHYTALLGKPSEVTYRFAEHVLAREALKLGLTEPLKTMYFIGDNPMSDIVGSNLYQRHLDRMKYRRRRISVFQQSSDMRDTDLPLSRDIPPGTKFLPQTIDTIESILVCTGVYQKGDDPEGDGKFHHGHRDFPKNTELHIPTFICDDTNSAIDYILLNEDIITS